jgi:hypothetical protein
MVKIANFAKHQRGISYIYTNFKLNKMKNKISLCLLSIILTVSTFSQTLNKTLLSGLWTEKDNRITEIKWAFNSNGTFNSIAFWNNPVQVGGVYRVGKFNLDDTKNSFTITYEKTFTATNNSVETHDNLEIKHWQVKSISENEIVITRQPSNENDKKLPNFNGTDIEIRLKKTIQKL